MLPLILTLAAAVVITPGDVPVVADVHPDETSYILELKEWHRQYGGVEPAPILLLAEKHAPRSPHPLAPAYVEQLFAVNFQPEDLEWARRVSFCESEWDATVPNRQGSSAIGLWQFIRSTWDWIAGILGFPDYNEGGPLDPELATRAAAYLYYNYGPQHWECK